MQLISTYKALVKHFGNQEKTALKLEVAQNTVSDWCTGKCNMSPIVAARAQEKSQGLFLAKDLCPEIKEVLEILEKTQVA